MGINAAIARKIAYRRLTIGTTPTNTLAMASHSTSLPLTTFKLSKIDSFAAPKMQGKNQREYKVSKTSVV